jgi:DNA-binding response OmpR family regulator
MSVVLICSVSPLEAELSRTLLWRTNVQRHMASHLEQALSVATAERPDLVAIDRRFPRIVELVTALRRDATARQCSVVVLSRGDFEPSEVEVLEAGANGILRFPPGPEWEKRLDGLLKVPMRKEARFAVQIVVDTVQGGESISGEALNLSAHGMLLQVPGALTVGETVMVSFRLPGAFVDGRGRVVRVAGTGRYGLYFEALERDGRPQIERFVGALA